MESLYGLSFSASRKQSLHRVTFSCYGTAPTCVVRLDYSANTTELGLRYANCRFVLRLCAATVATKVVLSTISGTTAYCNTLHQFNTLHKGTHHWRATHRIVARSTRLTLYQLGVKMVWGISGEELPERLSVSLR